MKRNFKVYHRVDRDRFEFDENLTPSNMVDSHVLVGYIEASDLDEVYEITNCNPPESFAQFCRDNRIHTSSSTGDVFVDTATNIAHQVACCGFEPVWE